MIFMMITVKTNKDKVEKAVLFLKYKFILMKNVLLTNIYVKYIKSSILV